jgi:hypothetical protein
LLAGDSCPDSLLIYSSLIGVKSNFTILLSLPVSILEMSNDLTGNQALGGDWDLEIATGKIEAAVPFNQEAMEDYEYTLGNYNVTVATDDGTGTVAGTLSKAILDANAAAGNDTITIQTNVRFTGTPNVPINSNIAFIGGGFSVSGDINNNSTNDAGDVQPFFVKSGIVSFSNMTISGGRAQGGDGGVGRGGGGGAAGMGGGLFIYNGTVSLNTVTFNNNQAIGGKGIAGNNDNTFGGGGGGGIGGNGGNGLTGNVAGIGGSSGIGGNGIGGSGGPGFGINGGFGGGGGGIGQTGNGGMAGFGGGGSGSFNGGSVGGNGNGTNGGGGAGLGGAIFIRQGSLTLNSATFNNNTATGGTGLNPGKGLGGAIFAMQSLTNSNGNDLGMPTTLPTVTTLGATFTGNTAADQANTPNATTPTNGVGNSQDNNDVYGTILGNTAPVLADTVVTLSNILEDAVAPTGAVGNLISSIAAIGTNITDPDTGAVAGVAITVANTTDGSWFYTIDGGTTWTALGAVSDTNARLLAADANTRIYFQPTTANYNGTITNGITFRAWDTTSGTNGSTADTSTNGGSTAFSNTTDTAAITVTPVNDIPSFTATNPTAVNEDAGAQTIPSWATFSPGGGTDEATQTATYTVSNIGTPGLFAVPPAIDANGNLTYTPATDANGTSTFDVVVKDSGGTANGGVDTSTTQTFTIAVLNHYQEHDIMIYTT